MTNDDSRIRIQGKLIIEEGATINMSKDSYIEVEKDGQLVINGTATNMVTITGIIKNTNNSNGPGILFSQNVFINYKICKYY